MEQCLISWPPPIHSGCYRSCARLCHLWYAAAEKALRSHRPYSVWRRTFSGIPCAFQRGSLAWVCRRKVPSPGPLVPADSLAQRAMYSLVRALQGLWQDRWQLARERQLRLRCWDRWHSNCASQGARAATRGRRKLAGRGPYIRRAWGSGWKCIGLLMMRTGHGCPCMRIAGGMSSGTIA